MGLVLKRARFFITINGRYLGDGLPSPEQLAAAMYAAEKPSAGKLLFASRQMRLFYYFTDYPLYLSYDGYTDSLSLRWLL